MCANRFCAGGKVLPSGQQTRTPHRRVRARPPLLPCAIPAALAMLAPSYPSKRLQQHWKGITRWTGCWPTQLSLRHFPLGCKWCDLITRAGCGRLDPKRMEQMTFDFETVIERLGTGSSKWSRYAPDVTPMWVADMDFSPDSGILSAIRERLDHPMLGYGIPPTISEAPW